MEFRFWKDVVFRKAFVLLLVPVVWFGMEARLSPVGRAGLAAGGLLTIGVLSCVLYWLYHWLDGWFGLPERRLFTLERGVLGLALVVALGFSYWFEQCGLVGWRGMRECRSLLSIVLDEVVSYGQLDMALWWLVWVGVPSYIAASLLWNGVLPWGWSWWREVQ
jgi:hypothetical protein